MKDILWLDDKMVPAQQMIAKIMGGEGTTWGRMVQNGIASISGEAHTRLRNILAPLFTPRQANLNREVMREVMSRLLDVWAPKGAFNFEEFISNFPIGVVCAMIGAPAEEIPRLRSSLETLGLQFAMDPTMLPDLEKAIVVIDEFAQQVLADRRAGKRPERGGQLLDVLLDVTGEGGISERELLDLLIFLFVAGYDTSKNMMTWTMYDMLSRPDCYKRCAEDLSYCDKVVEETFRYHSVATIPRVTIKDIEYRDVLIPAGTMLFLPVNIAGRDPTAFSDPDKYDPERKDKNRHIAFGRGAHVCLGQFIARTQIGEGMHLIAQRLVNPKLAGAISWRPFFGVWGLKGLPVEFEQGQRA
jgi:cytochrome P450